MSMFTRIFNLEEKKAKAGLIQPLQPASKRPVPTKQVSFTAADGKEHLLFAEMAYPQYGTEHDIAAAKTLDMGARYCVAEVRIDRSPHGCCLGLVGTNEVFNPVQFKFTDETGADVDVYNIPEFQIYFFFPS